MRGTHGGSISLCLHDGIIPAYAGNTTRRERQGDRDGDHPRVCGEHPAVKWIRAMWRGSSPRMRGTPSCVKSACREDRDHPRVCGEHCGCGFAAGESSGSSPRMRGTQVVLVAVERQAGIIPAYAGNTTAPNVPISFARDHPRVCGEHLSATKGWGVRGGSSPRMRGTPLLTEIDFFPQGIIPAYAGNTFSQFFQWFPHGDHPRVCGEHPGDGRLVVAHTGSSPRMRGTRLALLSDPMRIGIIPAYAGNTNRPAGESRTSGDHPRVCGEHHATGRERVQVAGSSPRMRGTPLLTEIDFFPQGIIPAYAGNTCSAMLNSFSFRDHPRVCGEHSRHTASSSIHRGSSPRMRGTRHHRHQPGLPPGIIPAYAGNTPGVTVLVRLCGDHPRVCGEHAYPYAFGNGDQGSSPRMRGTPRHNDCPHHPIGIIPAYAGNTNRRPRNHSRCRDHPRVCGEHMPTGWNDAVSSGSSPRMRGTPLHDAYIGGFMGIIPAYAGNTSLSIGVGSV